MEVEESCFDIIILQELSLYSTATQKHSRWTVALGNTPNARVLHWLVSKTLKFEFPPTQPPQPEQVEYRSRWVPNAKFLHWPCRSQVVCVNFIYNG